MSSKSDSTLRRLIDEFLCELNSTNPELGLSETRTYFIDIRYSSRDFVKLEAVYEGFSNTFVPGELPYEKGMLVGNFELNPLRRPIWAWPNLF